MGIFDNDQEESNISITTSLAGNHLTITKQIYLTDEQLLFLKNMFSNNCEKLYPNTPSDADYAILKPLLKYELIEFCFNTNMTMYRLTDIGKKVFRNRTSGIFKRL